MKKLEDMRVVELRAELEKRNLDKNGVKVVLIERLRKALEESGESQTSEEMADAKNSEEEHHASNDDAAAAAVASATEQNGHSCQDIDENSCNDGESKDASYLSESGDMRVTDQVDEQEDDDEEQLQRPRRDDEEQDLAKRPSDQSYEREDRENSWSRDGGEDQRDYQRERLDEDDESRFNDGDDSRYADDRSHFTDEHSRFTDEHSRFNDEDSRLSGDARAEDSQARDSEEVERREGNREEPRYSEAENSAEATEFSKRSDEAAPASAGNFEDEINFMLDEDDNMLEEEMIYEDGTTNRGGQVDANTVDGKADSSTGQHSNKKICGSNSNKSSGEKDASDGTTEGREGGDSATADAESTTADGANEDSSTKDTNNMENSEKKSDHSYSDAESASREDGVDDPKSTNSGRNLWVSGLSSSTRAQEIKSHFSKYGKVISAKIVMSAKSPTSKCYGFITMSSTDEASACIKNLNKTELRGRIIQVERAKDDPSANARRSLGHGEREPHGMQHSGSHEPRRRSEHPEDLSGSREHSRDRHGRPRVVDHRYGAPRPIRALGPRLGHNMPFREDGPRGNLSRRLSSRLSPSALRKLSPRHMEKQPLGISQIVEERERQRVRVRERLIREDERRAREDENRQRLIERRQREEAERLQREREALRAERERIERQKQELLRLEREQQRLEREKLEREREELRRQQMKLAHGPDRMDMKGVIPRFDDPRGGRSLKRPADDRGNRGDHYDDRKRAALDRMGGDSRQRYVPPAPPVHSRRYESGGRSDNHRYDNSYGGRDGGSSGGRFDRSGGPMGGGPSGKPSHPQGDHIRWMSGGPGGAPGASNGRRSDGYYDDRRGDGRNSGSSGSESRSSRNYHVSYIAPPPAPVISKGGESGSRMSRDSGGKASYGGGSDVWRTGSSKSSGYGGGSSSSSSKNTYGSGSSSSKGAYGGPSDSASSGGLLPAPHDSSTWRGSVSSSSSSSRWPSDSRGGGSSSGVGGNSGGSSSVPSYGGSGLPSSITSHHASSVASVPSQETRGSYGVPAAPYRKY